MTHVFVFDRVEEPAPARALRQEVRAFLTAEIAAGTFVPGTCNYLTAAGDNPAFSRKLGARGWIGMTWPKRYGGQERSFMERYVVTEELLAHGAPARVHWSAERQYGPLLLKHGQEWMRAELLPRIARGELYTCIGLSEPNAGSDVFAAATRATKTDGGWRVDGRKVWTSKAHNAHYMVCLLRTSPATTENRRHGLTQLLIDLSAPGVTIRPIVAMTGQHFFNEVIFDDVFVPENCLIGTPDMAWLQVTGELVHERAGPERFLETIHTLRGLVRVLGAAPDDREAEGLGREIAHLATLRRMAFSVAGMLEAGKEPVAEASVTKDLGTNWEQAVPRKARLLAPADAADRDPAFGAVLRYDTLSAPNFTIGGGSREVLRGIIARGLGLR